MYTKPEVGMETPPPYRMLQLNISAERKHIRFQILPVGYTVLQFQLSNNPRFAFFYIITPLRIPFL